MRKLAILLAAAAATAAVATATAASGPVTYTMLTFKILHGTTITLPAGWTKAEDDATHFVVTGPHWKPGPGIGDRVMFWADPSASAGGTDQKPLAGVGKTPAALISWLRSNKKLIVLPPKTRTIGGRVKAQSVDLHVSPTAGKEANVCDKACWSYLNFAGSGDYGTGTEQWVRLYLASIRRAGSTHVLAIIVEGTPRPVFTGMLSAASRIIDSLKLPSTITSP